MTELDTDIVADRPENTTNRRQNDERPKNERWFRVTNKNKTPLRTHPVRRNGVLFICTYTQGYYDKCINLLDEWTEGTTWSSIWGVHYDAEITLAAHYRDTCTIYDTNRAKHDPIA